MKINKIIIVALAAVFAWTLVGPQPVSAAAPASLTVTSGQSEQYAYYDFDSTTQITIERGGTLEICTGYDNKVTLNANITFSSTGTGDDPKFIITTCLGSPGAAGLEARGGTFNGTVTLNTDAQIKTVATTLTMNGSLVANGHNLAIITSGVSKVRGSGTVGSVSLADGAFIAPGASPGILNTGNLTFVSGSTYEFELGGTTAGTGYDQINVTGTVTLGSGTLDVILHGGFKPTNGQKFTIIANDGSDAVSGTFTGLAEGATFTDEGVTYRISYVGGDGNDVQLTVGASSPDTGFGLIMSNPFVTASIMVISAFGILFIVKKYSSVSARR